MQLTKLYIEDHKILKNFTINFPYDSKKYISVFIGANGSGKSTIIEVIANIFSDAILRNVSTFSYELVYSISNQSLISSFFSDNEYEGSSIPVLIKANKGELPIIGFDDTVKKYISIEPNSFKLGLLQRNHYNLLPENIVIYYSGLSEIIKNLCKPHEDRLSKAYRKGDTNINRDFFYYTPEHFGIILLSLLSYEFGDIPDFLKAKAKIEGLQSVQIQLQKPNWAKDTIENFWGAEGEVRNFLDYLKEKSKRKGKIVIETFQDEAIVITILGLKRLHKIKDHVLEEKKLFELFNIMLADGLLNDITFSLIKQEAGDNRSFSILSEGEQQAITIRGLTELLTDKNTLFLFDEPDTYLHPKWQRQFISEIESSIEQNSNIEIAYMIATHSPQLLSNANPEKTFVKIIEEGKLIESTPKYYGREISSILYNLMGVEERNKTISSDLSNLFALIEDEEIEDAEKELTRLTDILGDTDPDIKNAELQIGYLKEDEADN